MQQQTTRHYYEGVDIRQDSWCVQLCAHVCLGVHAVVLLDKVVDDDSFVNLQQICLWNCLFSVFFNQKHQQPTR